MGLTVAGGNCPQPGASASPSALREWRHAHPLAEVEGVSATTRHRWVATLRGGALLIALAAVMIVLTAAASLALSGH
jgi:hypothetical protein